MQELEKILEEIDKATDKYGMVDYINDEPMISKNRAKEIIRKHMNDGWIPVDKLDRKHGRWEYLSDCANQGVYCSVCHKKVYRSEYANQKIKSKYCPNCGAIMDGDFKTL